MINTKIVVFKGSASYSIHKEIAGINNTTQHFSWLIVLSAPPKKPTQLLKNQLKYFHWNGRRRIPYQTNGIWEPLPERAKGSNPSRSPGTEFSSSSSISRGKIRILTVEEIRADATLEAAKAFTPDVKRGSSTILVMD